ncbi:formate/nitrite transporter family protein [Pseudomonas nitroreducens]|uniref:formate/nitrite transporter family protein n=1 Tax=Pseudomonas nitroreducens TaxID=46680 RepID=UPI003820FB09
MATEKPPARGAAQSRPRSKGSDSAAKRKTAPRTQARESKAGGDTADDLSAEERRKVEKSQPPRALVLHEVIRLQGNHELERTLAALWWSALAAGLTIGLSLMAMGLFRARLPDHDMAVITTSLGYPVGFLAIILARQQLFTENTLTAVLPVMSEPTLEKFGQLLRLWSVVLLGNIVGALLFAYGMLHLPIFDTKADQAFLEIGREVMENDHWQMFSKGIVSGWMIATMVWLVPAAENAKVWIIFLVTYLMALGSFSHIVVGTCEVGYLMFAGEVGLAAFVIDFALPTLVGNIVGGSLIFALMSHAQVRSDTTSTPEKLPKKKTAP